MGIIQQNKRNWDDGQAASIKITIPLRKRIRFRKRVKSVLALLAEIRIQAVGFDCTVDSFPKNLRTRFNLHLI